MKKLFFDIERLCADYFLQTMNQRTMRAMIRSPETTSSVPRCEDRNRAFTALATVRNPAKCQRRHAIARRAFFPAAIFLQRLGRGLFHRTRGGGIEFGRR
jgi:hypothetical protein